MPNLNDMFPSKYVTGADLGGRSFSVTITRLSCEAMRATAQSAEANKWVVWTKEGKKGIVLSKTLAKQIAGALGSENTDDWIGKRVVIFPESVNVMGEARLAIRARAVASEEGK